MTSVNCRGDRWGYKPKSITRTGFVCEVIPHSAFGYVLITTDLEESINIARL